MRKDFIVTFQKNGDTIGRYSDAAISVRYFFWEGANTKAVRILEALVANLSIAGETVPIEHIVIINLTKI